MSQAIDIEAWRRDGEKLWAAIQAHKLVSIHWNNPWRRLAGIGLVPLVAAVVVGIFTESLIAAGGLMILSLPFLYMAAKCFRIGAQTGGLYCFFSEYGFGVGCDADRLSIPYSSIALPEWINTGTVNENYIVLPVTASSKGVQIEQKTGVDLPWDGKPYTRGIVSVFFQDGEVRVRAYPNEMIVHLFSAIYPLSVYLSRRESANDLASPPRPASGQGP